MAIVPYTSDPHTTLTPILVSRSDESDEGKSFGNLYQNYFAFVAVAVVVALVCACVLYRRKKRIVYQANVSRQIALTRDIEDQGLRANRGWGWGALSRDYSSGPAPRGQPLGVLSPWRRRREEEGLNEAGEAPPAYKTAPDDNDTVLETAQPASPANPTIPAVPRPTLARENTGLKPPDYTETVVSSLAPGRASSSTTIPTSTTTPTNPHTDSQSNDLPTYHDSHERG
ncbi:unnamed protein product [Aureobasidium uvarum]|uniref:Uncharacterized protein n=1 Tax=Aureobasidium uvarum TaxID=2773716 RepID=A0A9N8KKA3_9PEZI|nr:unnamed protein product [Aureobasidium uvarum]